MQKFLNSNKPIKEIKSSKSKKFDINKFIKSYGIGKNRIFSFYNEFGLNNRFSFIKAKYKVLTSISTLVDKLTSRNTLQNKLVRIRKFTTHSLKNYKGARHLLRYPVRGQRTHTNGRTRKRLKNKNLCNLS